MCNILSKRLPVWYPDPQSYPFIKYNCAPHTHPFRLLAHRSTHQVICQNKYEQMACVMVKKTHTFIHKCIFLLFLTVYCQHVGTVIALLTHKYFRWLVHLWYLPSCPHTCPLTVFIPRLRGEYRGGSLWIARKKASKWTCHMMNR